MAGYLFLGFAYGVLMGTNGFPFWVPMGMAMTIFGGSLEYIAAELLLASFAPMQTFLIALLIQLRHLFYGMSLLEKYRGLGWKKPLLIFGLTDETFSINCSAELPVDVDRGWAYLFVTVLNWSYWVLGAAAGGLTGGLIAFSTRGLDFVMTAMFAVIFLDNWLREQRHWSSLIGLGASLVCLALFGAERFMIPSMLSITALLLLARGRVEGGNGQ